MKRLAPLLAALLVAGLVLAPTSAHADGTSSTESAAPMAAGDYYYTKHSAAHRATFTHLLGVLVNGHQVSSGNYITDRIDMACDAGCGVAGSWKFYNVDIELRGSGGAVLWSKDNVNVPSGGNLTWWPNRQHGKGAYWVITQGFIDNGANRDEVFMDSWEVVPDGAGAHPSGSYCVWV